MAKLKSTSSLHKKITRRFKGSLIKLRSNLKDIKETGFMWRISNKHTYTSAFDYQTLSKRKYGQAYERNPDTNNNLYNMGEYYDVPRDELWYTLNSDEQAAYDELYTHNTRSTLSKRYHHYSRKMFHKMMHGWNYIDDYMLKSAGIEGPSFNSIRCTVNVKYHDNDGDLQKYEYIDVCSQISGWGTGIYLPTALLTRPVNKNTVGYKNGLLRKRLMAEDKRNLNVFKTNNSNINEIKYVNNNEHIGVNLF